MIRVRFVCGHQQEVKDTISAAPICACGERRIAHVDAPPPHFVGTVTGPTAEYREMAPATVSLAPTPLPLKPIKEDDDADS